LIVCQEQIEIEGHALLRADHFPPDRALAWLERHIWACMRMDFDREDRVAWRVRWGAWPFVTASGAGKTFDQALLRCFQCAVIRMKEAEKCMASPEDLKDI
jgi:hypothetical protein